MKRTILLFGAALLWLAPLPAIEHVSSVQAAAAVSADEFVKTAGVAGMFEIESSKIATQKSQNVDVKSFAERMIGDHTKAAEELKTTASSADPKFMIPAELDAKHQKLMDELKSADQSKFDATYVRIQTDAHKEAVELFGNYAKEGDNPQLKTFAEKTLPTLQQHYDMIQQIGAKSNTAQMDQSSTGTATTTAQNETQVNKSSTGTATTTAQNEAQTTTAQPSAGAEGLTVTGLEPGSVVMLSNFIGSTVYNAANENVGDVNDVLISKDGKVQAVIIGVGGFLGLGEKDVAVPLDRIQFVRDENSNMKYTINASRQELEQAPAFDRSPWRATPPTTGQ